MVGEIYEQKSNKKGSVCFENLKINEKLKKDIKNVKKNLNKCKIRKFLSLF